MAIIMPKGKKSNFNSFSVFDDLKERTSDYAKEQFGLNTNTDTDNNTSDNNNGSQSNNTDNYTPQSQELGSKNTTTYFIFGGIGLVIFIGLMAFMITSKRKGKK